MPMPGSLRSVFSCTKLPLTVRTGSLAHTVGVVACRPPRQLAKLIAGGGVFPSMYVR
jgi:hypothetical protein